MIDIGINLGNERFDNKREEMLQRAVKAGLTGIIMTTTSQKSFNANIEAYKNHCNIISLFTTLGLHPHSAKDYKNFFANFDAMISKADKVGKPIVAIGEFGLDYNRMFSEKTEQIICAELHFEKAKDMKLPTFLHERDAHEDFLALMKKYPTVSKVVHCFTGSKKEMKAYLDLGAHIGITGWVTDNQRGQDLQEAVKYIPLDRLMIETDAPYLTPKNMPFKSRENEAAYLPYVLEKIAQIRNENVDELSKQIKKNTIEFFALPM